MLKFIGAGERGSLHQEPNFKTSHVKVYQTARDSGDDRNEISKHPMLKFIKDAERPVRCNEGISKHPMLKFIAKRFTPSPNSSLHFKTSHVKVYQIDGEERFCEWDIFQNIPC